MAAVVPLRHPAGEPSVASLEAQIAALTEAVAELARDRDLMRERLADLETRVPPPRYEVPAHYVTVKAAADISGFAVPTIYQWARKGRIKSAPDVGGRRFVDPTSFPRRA